MVRIWQLHTSNRSAARADWRRYWGARILGARRRSRAISVIALMSINAMAGVAADSLSEFGSAIANADALVRSARFYLRTGNVAVAAFELEQLAEAWNHDVLHSWRSHLKL